MKTTWYIYTTEYYSAMKNRNNAIAAIQADLEIVILYEVRQRKTNIWYHLYVESQRMIHINLFISQKQIHRHRKQTYGSQRRKVEGER